jgi:hypothetical protein
MKQLQRDKYRSNKKHGEVGQRIFATKSRPEDVGFGSVFEKPFQSSQAATTVRRVTEGALFLPFDCSFFALVKCHSHQQKSFHYLHFTLPTMIRAQKLPEILGSVLHDGILGAVLMTTEGSVISSLFTEQSSLSETVLAAVASSIWLNYSQGKDILKM